MNTSLLSDTDLVQKLLDLSRAESETTLSLVLHLIELEERRLHLALGYSSLFNYCTSKLRYSESAANRRIMTARAVKRFPELYPFLKRRELCLSTVSVISSVLTE